MRNNVIKAAIVGAGAIVLMSGCLTTPRPKSLGEGQSGFTYVPIDPFPVQIVRGHQTNDTTPMMYGTNLLQFLPDNAVRIAVEEFDSSNTVTYGPASLAGDIGTYEITADYINADTANIKLSIKKTVAVRYPNSKTERVVVPVTAPNPDGYVNGSDFYDVTRVDDSTTGTNAAEVYEPFTTTFNIPVYIGIGLRVTADITTLTGNLNITGLGAIGAAAKENKLRGTLVVQTLGVNGKSVSAALPIQSELNETTAENAVVAIGAIKALLYEPETVVVPRVVGLYLPFAGGKPLVNAIISSLSTKPLSWTPAGNMQ